MWTLIVMGHGRWGYQRRCLESVERTVGLDFFDRLVMSLDGGCEPLPPWADHEGRWEVHQLPSRQGLTANLAQAWGTLSETDEWVFHLEDDFVLSEAPLAKMAATLDAFPLVANMVLARQPWNAIEQRRGSVLATIPGLEERDGWCEHRQGFWLNPMVAHASLLRSLTPGVEQKLTRQCLDRRLSFGYWGGRHDPPRCEHIGERGGMGSPGWAA